MIAIVGVIYILTAAESAHAYFVRWGQEAAVRIQYENALVAKMDYLDRLAEQRIVAGISSNEPNRFHDPASAEMTLDNKSVDLRWYDGRTSVIFPQDSDTSLLMYASDAPLTDLTAPYLTDATLKETVSTPDDEIVIYEIDGVSAVDRLLTKTFTEVEGVIFGETVELIGFNINNINIENPMEVATMWRVIAPTEGLTFFTHLVETVGQPPVAQHDSLSVPSYFWQAGDIFVQVHLLDYAPTGSETVWVGMYTNPEPDVYVRVRGDFGDSYLLGGGE